MDSRAVLFLTYPLAVQDGSEDRGNPARAVPGEGCRHAQWGAPPDARGSERAGDRQSTPGATHRQGGRCLCLKRQVSTSVKLPS